MSDTDEGRGAHPAVGRGAYGELKIQTLIEGGIHLTFLTRVEEDALRAYFTSERSETRRRAAEREKNRRVALRGHFFWLPCDSCGDCFGGHESGWKSRDVNDPDDSLLCPRCAAVTMGVRSL